MYEIYSIGDATFLYGVVNAIAALAASDEYGVMAKIGLMLGVLFVVGRAAFSGGTSFPVGSLLGCMLLYLGFFGPTKEVAIIDVYTDQVRTVDHVPLGVAIAGSQVSAMGYRVTQLMEQAFSTPKMTEQGYGAALEALKRVRMATLTLYELNQMNGPTVDADWPRSWQQYIADCPLKGVQNDNRLKDPAAIFNQPLLGDGLRFESNLWGTRLDLVRPYAEPTCSEAFEALVDYTVSQFLPYLKGVLADRLGYVDVVALETAVGDALNAMGLSTSIEDYLASSALSAVYFSALRQRYAEDFQPAYATAVDDAVRQRNAQWMADESMLQQYMRPMITFLEAFIYAMTPFLVLLLGLGPYGVKVIIGFLITLIWITTWMPVLAIINFFEHFVAAAKMAALEGSGGLASMAGLFRGDSIVQTYLAVGGNMAAAVPALTASFLFIGARAFGANLFAGRLSGADTFKEEKAAPDSYHAPAMVSYESAYSYTQAGAHRGLTGADSITPTYQVGETLQRAESSAERRVESAGESFSQGFQRRLQQVYGQNETGSFSQMFGDSETASHTNSFAAASSWAASRARGIEGTEGFSDRQMAEMALGLQLGVPVSRIAGWIGFDPNNVTDPTIRAGIGQTSDQINARTERVAGQMEDALRNDHHQQATFAAALASDVQQRHESTVFASESVTGDRSLQRQASDVISASQEYSRIAATSADVGHRTSLPERAIVGMLKRHPEVRDHVLKQVTDLGELGRARDIESGIRFIYPETGDAMIASEFRAMMYYGSPYERQSFLSDLMMRLSLTGDPELRDPSALHHVADGLAPAGTVEERVDGMDGLGGDLEDEVRGTMQGRQHAVEAGAGHVAGRSAGNNADVQHEQQQQRRDGETRYEVTTDQARELGSNTNAATGLQSLQGGLIGYVKDAGDWIEDQINPDPLLKEDSASEANKQ